MTTYVYRIFDRFETVYIGKGSGRRVKHQATRFKCQGEIIEHCKTDEEAFKAERKWIAELKPTMNRHPGGQGGRLKPKKQPRPPSWVREMEEMGTRKYAARFLVSRLDERNCERYGVSIASLNKVREVANGPRC